MTTANSFPPPDDTKPSIATLIATECDALKTMLLDKNQRYGNAALDPIRIFSRADPVEQIRVRIDDKLSRLVRGAHHTPDLEDVERDLAGYLILLRVARSLHNTTT